MRKLWIIALAILLLTIGIVFGIYFFNRNETQDSNTNNKQLAIENIENKVEENVISTSAIEKRTSPNATILKKQYFTGCDHLIKTSVDIPEELVNKTKQEVQNYYLGWTVDSFSEKEITIYQEKKGICNQHYLVKEHNGVLGIYTLDENGNATLKEDTEIQTMYLPEIDLQRVKQGIEAVGDMALNTVLEDFE